MMYYSDVSLPKRQKRGTMKGVVVSLNGNEGDNESMLCPIAT